MKHLRNGLPAFALALTLLGFGPGCGVSDTQPGETPSADEASEPSTVTPANPSAMADSPYVWWEEKLDRCGKNTNCGAQINYNEGFYYKRQCTCQNTYCGSYSCSDWQGPYPRCGC